MRLAFPLIVSVLLFSIGVFGVLALRDESNLVGQRADRSGELGDAGAADRHEGQVDLLTPVVKAYGADQAFRIAERQLLVGHLHP